MDRGRSNPGPGWPIVAVLAVGAFTTALNVTILSPLLTRIAGAFAVSTAAAGQLATVTAIASGLTALVVTPFMDRFSRGAWLRFECGLLVVGTLVSILAPSFAWLFVGRAIAGVGGAVVYGTCMAVAAEVFPEPRRRNQIIGFLNTAATLGAVVGLPVVTWVGNLAGWRWGASLVIPTAAIVFLGSFRLIGTTNQRVRPAFRRGDWLAGYRAALGARETVWLLSMLLTFCLVWFAGIIYLGAFAEEGFAIGPGTLSLLFLVSGAAEIVGGNLTPYLLRRWSPRAVAGTAIVVLAVNLLAVGIIWTRAWLLFPMVFIASAAGIAVFACTTILLLESRPAAQGGVMALQSAGFELGAASGAAVFGLGLAFLHEYETVYRLLGIVVLPVIGCLLISGRYARDSTNIAEPGGVVSVSD